MDLYLSTQDGFSLQEMLDCDIKCEIDDSFGFDGDLPPLDLEDDSKHAWVHGNSNSSFELDFFNADCSASLIVNPNSVMPLPSMLLKKESETENDIKPIIVPSSVVSLAKSQSPPVSPVAKTTQAITVVTSSLLSSNSFKGGDGFKRTIATLNGTSSAEQKQQTTPVSNSINSNKARRTPVPASRKLCLEENLCYPKPAYSYSCLIAMALKNSRSGSLPVSEIYNFMCDHFPYFKTAPNGWKNSVRHNLSLNKCFEKIEKPVSGPGGTQRKGCLWAMNPSKIAKMDDEVAKWSRRDPLAIKKAMLNPEKLEMLERGELKVGRAHGDSEGEVDVEEEEYTEQPTPEQPVEEEVAEEDDDDEDDEEDEDEDDDDEDNDPQPIPIGSDESDDELSRMPPSLQPFEPRLALLNRHINDSNESRLPINLNDFNIEVVDDFDIGYEQLDMEESRAFLGLDVETSKFIDESEDESTSEELMNHRTHHEQSLMVSKKRKGSPSLIQGNYVCVKRKLVQPSLSCRSVN